MEELKCVLCKRTYDELIEEGHGVKLVESVGRQGDWFCSNAQDCINTKASKTLDVATIPENQMYQHRKVLKRKFYWTSAFKKLRGITR